MFRVFQVREAIWPLIPLISMFIFLGGCRLRHLSWITKLTLQFRDSTIQHHSPNCFRPNNVTWPLRWRSYPCVGRLGQVGGWSIHGRRWRQCCRSFGCSYAATFVWRFLGAIVMQEPPRLVEKYQCTTNVSKDGGSILLVVVVKCKMSSTSSRLKRGELGNSEIFVCALFPLNKTKRGLGPSQYDCCPNFHSYDSIENTLKWDMLAAKGWCILH